MTQSLTDRARELARETLWLVAQENTGEDAAHMIERALLLFGAEVAQNCRSNTFPDCQICVQVAVELRKAAQERWPPAVR